MASCWCHLEGRIADIKAGLVPMKAPEVIDWDKLTKSPRPFPAAALRHDWEPR